MGEEEVPFVNGGEEDAYYTGEERSEGILRGEDKSEARPPTFSGIPWANDDGPAADWPALDRVGLRLPALGLLP
jgi:hypothetical protein